MAQQQQHVLASPNARAVFDHALEIRSPAERQAYVDEACGDDAGLRQRVEALLKAYDEAGSFLESIAPDVGPGATPGQPTLSPLREGPGSVVGRYKLLQQIGEGGMGVVFLAEQTRPVRRQVALKVVKAGMDTRQVVARFEAERQALALMDHPNIARVLDAGATESGRPYFVMELVKGVPITRYCDARRLTPRERLGLFIQVCSAVQHAHTKGIIHRDLKPGNVLVTMYDGNPVPKVIDFGVAKATGGRLTEATLFTGFGALVGTPEYMSPEQAELNQLDVDTRSDVYSLGVLLYELLTGSTPLDRSRFKGAALLEMLRVVREEEPARPSTRLSTTDQLLSIAASRGLEPRKLSGVVRGELDWIVMRALEKDRARRYETAHGLATDVARYLADEPVHACPPSAAYRFRKFARRNKAALATMTLVVAAVLTGTAVAIEANMRTADLLKQSRSLAGELQTQQEALRRTNAELEEKAGQIALTSRYKSEFLEKMAHELRRPLDSLLSVSDHLAGNAEGNLTSRQVELARTIHGSGSDLLALISDITDLSKIESGTAVVDAGEVPLHDLRDYAERTFRHVAEEKKVRFEVRMAAGLPPSIHTDGKRLRQILQNLVSNAFELTEKGHVAVDVGPVTGGWSPDNPSLNAARQVIAFTVSDTGTGIPPEKQQVMFEAFQKADESTGRRYGGTGLGLALTREIARLLGGEIRLSSTPGAGSHFTLYLPQQHTPAGLEKRSNNSGAAPDGPRS